MTCRRCRSLEASLTAERNVTEVLWRDAANWRMQLTYAQHRHDSDRMEWIGQHELCVSARLVIAPHARLRSST